jgi:hypothetical protein
MNRTREDELRLRRVLRDHFVMAIECDHVAKTDRVLCSCSAWRSDPQPSVGAAVDVWIDHVFQQDYADRTLANLRIEGIGADVKTYIACPFCAAADWLCLPIAGTKKAMEAGATCQACGRSAKAIFSGEGHTQFEIVQTGGDDPPAWLEPKMRRL